jgi:hypothetical protein
MTIKLTIVLMLMIHEMRAQPANRYDIVIDEIMADPTPAVGLPNTEFIELKNVSARSLNLNGWTIGDGAGFATISTNFVLMPDSFVVICTNSAVNGLSVFGTTLGVSSFPSLDNMGEQIYLRSKEGSIIHAVEYNINWYQNGLKKEGGWTLEMIDTRNPCGAIGNWTASIEMKGGTPGHKNSVDAMNNDQQPPVLMRAFATDSITITLLFDEPLDSLPAATAANYFITDGIGRPLSAMAVAPSFNSVQLKTTVPLIKNKVYILTATDVTDCTGNTIGAYHNTKVGLAPAVIDSFSLVINEILFNPKPDGVDYAEIYNRSNGIINLKECYIANRAANGNIGSLKQLSTEIRLLFPNEYLVITEDAAIVKQQYVTKQPDAFAEIASMPSFPDNKGTVLLVNALGKIIDELKYDEQWHFKLLDNVEGISLERIDYNKPTMDAANWHSAATNVGYGTPGYQNSQYKTASQAVGSITLTPGIFSPDNDGFDDFATVTYQFPEAGYICNMTIFDANGRPVRYLTRNALCGISGYFRWDGLDEKNAKLPVGVYVVYTEVFNAQGKTNRFKNALTLARRLH